MPTQLLFTRFLNAHFAAQVDALLRGLPYSSRLSEAPINDAFAMELLVFVFLLVYFIVVRVTLDVEKPNPVQHLAEG